MSEIKTIKVKVEFLAIPAFDHEISGRKCHRLKLSESESDDVTELRKNNDWVYLTTATEEQCSLLVDYFIFSEKESGSYTAYRDYLDEYGFVMTAKESLFSLLKTNGCCIKEWIEKPNINEFKSIPFCESGECKAYFDEVSVWEKLPDDYLLIIKQ